MEISIKARQEGKSLIVEKAKEQALNEGKTVIVCRPNGASKYRRIRRKGRSLDVIESLKRSP